jgi:DNA-directed RNA polymerase subunit M/transcription elongation factor TFIIS
MIRLHLLWSISLDITRAPTQVLFTSIRMSKLLGIEHLAVQFNPNRGNMPVPANSDSDDSSSYLNKKPSAKNVKRVSRLESDDSSDDSDDDSHKKHRRKKKKKKKSKKVVRLESNDSSDNSDDDSRKKHRCKKKKKSFSQDQMMALMMQQQMQQQVQMMMTSGMGVPGMNHLTTMMNPFAAVIPSDFGTMMSGQTMPTGAK